jgi:hypothetical protein
VVRDDHADAAVPQVGDDLLDVVHRDRVHAGERLVQQHELRLRHQRARDLQPPPLAARQRVRLRLPQVLQAQLVEQRSSRAFRSARFSGIVSRIARMFSSTVSFRKIDGSCAR